MRILTTLAAVEAVKIEYSKSADMGYRLQVLLNVVEDVEPDAALRKTISNMPPKITTTTNSSVRSLSALAANSLGRRSSVDRDRKGSEGKKNLGEHC